MPWAWITCSKHRHIIVKPVISFHQHAVLKHYPQHPILQLSWWGSTSETRHSKFFDAGFNKKKTKKKTFLNRHAKCAIVTFATGPSSLWEHNSLSKSAPKAGVPSTYSSRQSLSLHSFSYFSVGSNLTGEEKQSFVCFSRPQIAISAAALCLKMNTAKFYKSSILFESMLWRVWCTLPQGHNIF